GSAVGLGNIWRFSYVAGENGGGAFVILYCVAVATIGLPLLIAELALGRATRADPVAAYARVVPTRPWCWIGWIGVVASVGILAYYPIIAGWVLRYLWSYLTGPGLDPALGTSAVRFSALLASPSEQLLWLAIIVAASAAIVAVGIDRGIERACKIAMPAFVLLLVALAIHGLSLPGRDRALAFLFVPDWSAFLAPRTYIAAIGQAFFSIGLAMAILVTYGAYLPRDIPLPAAAATIALGDTAIALIAGLMIFPAVFSHHVDPAHGATLAFVVLPEIFAAMPSGRLVAIAFFLLLFLAALTSLVALVEVPVTLLIARRGWTRGHAAILVGFATMALATAVMTSGDVVARLAPAFPSAIELIDQVVSNLVLPISGIAIALVVGWAWPRPELMHASGLTMAPWRAAWLWLLRIVLPGLVAVVMLRALTVI
ncbi:MAG: sodium-dependent transporter, partial [Alphaproteobacteria bacterium]|nr:sodium-dependent transporter [Alphaproteobacteria bacterium]